MGLKVALQGRIESLAQRIERLLIKYHRTYFAFFCLFAFTGYAFVMVFPVLAVFSLKSITEILLSEAAFDLQMALIWFVALLFSVQISYRMFITRPVPAVGFTMPESKIPKVYEVVEKLQSHFKRPVIHRIIISANYEVDIVKTPRWMMPVWSTNTLVIGLPLLICLTPDQFEHMVARRIGQFSKKNNMVTNWLYQLNGIWQQYSYIYGKQKMFESRILKLFYMIYAALYEKFSVQVARKDELNADGYAMEMYSHEVICEMITADALCRWYLEKRFWPAIDKSYSLKPQSSIQPFRKLTTVIRNNLNSATTDILKKLAQDEAIERNHRFPLLRQRLEKIGYAKPQLSKYSSESAADFYLGKSLNGALNLMDKLWLKNKKKKQVKKKHFIRSLVPVLKGG